ncbi:MAG: TGS domain-containing protein [Candidatus Pacearchaeota archaeon]
MPINASYEFTNAEKIYLQAKTLEEKIAALEEMISKAPSHKGAENLRAELKARLKKLKEKQEKTKSSGKTTKKVIKKEGYQCALVGLPNSGKSSLLSVLTNAKPKISEHPFSTKEPEIGTMDYQGVKAQILDLPSIGSEFFDIGQVNTADCLILVIENLQDLEKINPLLSKATGKRIIAVSKSDRFDESQMRKILETIKSKRLDAIIISSVTNYNIEALKEKIFSCMDSIRVYTKEPGKAPSPEPITLPKNSTVKDVAESILKGFSKKVKEARVTGPSSKFPNQRVGLNHILKDKDIVEFKTF